MSYATLTALTAKFGERFLIRLTDRADVSTGAIDTTVVDQALADTDAMIDGFLKGRYVLPVADVPPQLTDLGLSIAIYKLHIFKPDEKIGKDYDDAVKMLRDIAQGTVQLSIAGVAVAETGGSSARFTDRDRPFTAEKMQGFI